MSNSEIFRQVAARQLTPREGVEQMIELDKQERARLRPRWMPVPIWVLCTVIFASLLAACGVPRE